jgi:hypothetical protein
MIVGGHRQDLSKVRFNYLSLGDSADASVRLCKPFTDAKVFRNKALEGIREGLTHDVFEDSERAGMFALTHSVIRKREPRKSIKSVGLFHKPLERLDAMRHSALRQRNLRIGKNREAFRSGLRPPHIDQLSRLFKHLRLDKSL